MDTLSLEEPILSTDVTSTGVPNVNFFNGRLLTARDLAREQEARRQIDWRLGQAIGNGVAYGLEVKAHPASTLQNPMVTVEAGLAINREGQTLMLGSQAAVALVRKSKQAAVAGTTFSQCGNLQTGTYVAGPGVYLLTIAPATGKQGLALTSGFDTTGGKCNTDTIVETVQFRLILIDFSGAGVPVPTQDLAPESKFRNQIAALCLGWQYRDRADPFAGVSADPVVKLAGTALTSCDVPLALIYWTLSGGIRFTDMWAVRRRLRRAPDPALVLLSPRTEQEVLGEARLLQFVAQLRDVLTSVAHPDQHRIEEFFRYVPPAAYVPVRGAGSPSGAQSSTFFGSFTSGLPDHITAGMVSEILRRSFSFSPVDLTGGACLQLFEVDENVAAVSSGAAKQRIQVFVTRALDGPAVDDALSGVFETAWTVYRGILIHRLFLPLGSAPEEIAMQLAITGAVRDVMDVATRQASRAGAWSLDESRALSALQDLYQVQSDLQVLLASDFPGVTDVQDRKQFASLYSNYLDGPLSPGVALHDALSAKDMCQAVAAQNAVNQFVAGWSGEGIAVGPTFINFLPGNLNTVPGGDAAAHQFELHNGTDRSLTFVLSAAISAPHGDWTRAATVHQISSATELQSIDIRSGGVATLEVQVRAPLNVPQIGDTVKLTVEAVVGPPHTDFDFVVTLTTAHPETWTVVINGALPDSSTPPGTFAKRITLTAGQTSQASLELTVPAHGPESGAFQISVASTALQPQLTEVFPTKVTPANFDVTVT